MTRSSALEGACHCGNIRYVLKWPADVGEIPARECGCSFCRKHGGSWTSSSRGSLSATVQHASLVSRYAFGTETAEFHVCSRCGVVPFVTSEIEGNTYAVVNVNTLGDLAGRALATAPVTFDSEDTADRLARRKRNWIPEVRIEVER